MLAHRRCQAAPAAVRALRRPRLAVAKAPSACSNGQAAPVSSRGSCNSSATGDAAKVSSHASASPDSWPRAHGVLAWRGKQRCPQHRFMRRLTPHSGYHFDGSNRRFFEGWYFKVTLPGSGQSFALIYSVADPAGSNKLSSTAAQIMGPDDTYMVQYDADVSHFWADRDELALGACFEPVIRQRAATIIPRQIVTEKQFFAAVQQGYQASLTCHQGRIVRSEEGATGYLPSTADTCEWSFTVEPHCGWGDTGGKQQATAGWLSALPVFEPHWQVLMAHGRATGWITWGGERYEFEDAPSYAEKNWGGGFPDKWFWMQCDSFEGGGMSGLTCAGARRGILGLPGVRENVGVIGIHHDGQFINIVQAGGSLRWDVSPWGRWFMEGDSQQYAAEVEATCTDPGTRLRAPTINMGLAPLCTDSFFGDVTVRYWRKGPNGQRLPESLVELKSNPGGAAVEIGGGPWDEDWRVEAEMREPLRSVSQLPVDVDSITSLLPPQWRSPGL